jgi:hypothetical protein
MFPPYLGLFRELLIFRDLYLSTLSPAVINPSVKVLPVSVVNPVNPIKSTSESCVIPNQPLLEF